MTNEIESTDVIAGNRNHWIRTGDWLEIYSPSGERRKLVKAVAITNQTTCTFRNAFWYESAWMFIKNQHYGKAVGVLYEHIAVAVAKRFPRWICVWSSIR